MSTAGSIPRAPLIGRDLEMGRLAEALARAHTARRPGAVTVIGGAGMGKGRLTDAFLDEVASSASPPRVLRGNAMQSGGSLGPIQRILRARFGITESTEPDVARGKLREAVSDLLEDRRVTEFVHFLGAYLDLSFPESPFTKALEAEAGQLARISRAVLRRFLEADARKRPLILSFEQLHDAHDETLDLIRYLTESLSDAPILVLTTARPELTTRVSAWTDGEHHQRIELAPLSPEDASELVRALIAPVADPPAELIEAAVDMAGGSPYLLEQMVRTFLESKTLVPRPDGTWVVNLARLDDASLPLTVDDAIRARIASMAAPEREILERAAVMGGVFWLGALVSMGRLGRPLPALWGGAEDLAGHYRDLLSGLEKHDYVFRFGDSSIPGEEEYAFKHNLEREALYRLLSTEDKARYHRRVAEWLEMRLTERGEEAFELLATHHDAGGAPHRAAHYYLLAGDGARARYSNTKAAEYYARGLERLGEDDVVRRLDALHAQGDVLQLLGENDAALASFRAMLELAYQLDHKAKGGAAHNRIGRLYRAIGQLEEAMRNLGTGHALFDAVGDERGVAASLDDVGKVHWMRGAYEPAERFAKRGLELRRQHKDRRSIGLSLNNLGLVYQDSGRFEEALAAWNEALSIRRDIDDWSGMAQTLNNLGTIHQDNGDHIQACTLWEQALGYARKVGDRMREAVILTNLGESSYRQGQPERAIEVLSQAEQISASLGDRILEAEILRGLAEARTLLGDLDAARQDIERSIAIFGEARSKPFLGVALRTLGELEGASPAQPEARTAAEKAFRESIALFEELGNEVELAHSCTAFAGFLAATADGEPGRLAEAATLRDRALTTHGKQLASGAYALPPLDGEDTHPGVPTPEE
ncbi:MAG: tetratricopeptide repeat protein [Sandaracinaceae bacterium]